jgi:hypothetical protein
MTTLIKIEGESPYLIPHVDHIVASPWHTNLEPVYVQLSVPAADALC